MSVVLFISPHPDDEVLGCGGTIFKHKQNGDTILWLVVSTGYTCDGFSKESVESMEKQVDSVRKFVGFSSFKRLKFPSAKLDNVPMADIVSEINDFINRHKPDTIYVNYRGDAHTDHKIVFDSVWSCCKSFRNPFVRNVYVYEVVSESNYHNPLNSIPFSPNTYQDISLFLDLKIEAFCLYGSELGQHPNPRSVDSIKALAKLRGSESGLVYAEAFMCVKQVV